MSVTIKHLGFVIKNRDEYIANPETKYFKDNVVQYKDSSFICSPVDYDPVNNQYAYTTIAPLDSDGNLNEGWEVFAIGADTLAQQAIEEAKNQALNEINNAVQEYAPVQITGDVNNAADEEDITSVNVGGTDVLKLKDKSYNSLLFSGLGKTNLRKNIQEVTVEEVTTTKNILTKDMIDDANTIYKIQYDYDLNGATIIIPSNCTLEFDGGSLRNGTVTGNNTVIKADQKIIFKDEIHISGTWSCANIYSDWFTFNNIDNRVLLNEIFNMSNYSTIYINGNYKVSAYNSNEVTGEPHIGWTCLHPKSNSTIIVNGSVLLNDSGQNNSRLLDFYDKENIQIIGGLFVGDREYKPDGLGNGYKNSDYGVAFELRYCSNINISNVEIKETCGDGISINNSNNIVCSNIYVHDNGRQNISITDNIKDVYVGHFKFENAGYYVTDNVEWVRFSIDLEPNSSESLTNAYLENIIFEDGSITAYRGIQVYKPMPTQFSNNINFKNILLKADYKKLVINLSSSGNVNFSKCTFEFTGNETDNSLISVHNHQVSSMINFTDCVFNSTGLSRLFVAPKSKNSSIIISNSKFNVDDVGLIGNAATFNNCIIKCFSTSHHFVKNSIGKTAMLSFNNCKIFINITEDISNLNFSYLKFNNSELHLNLLSTISYILKGDCLDFINSKIVIDSVEQSTASSILKLSNSTINGLIFAASSPYSINALIYNSYANNFISNVMSDNITILREFTNNNNYGFIAKSIKYYDYGPTSSRPTINNSVGYNGFRYYDIDTNKSLYWSGSKWLESDGAVADVLRSGTFANKPSASNIYVGFKYFCTDKQTVEGATDGIEIIHKGNDVWVDALGRVVN